VTGTDIAALEAHFDGKGYGDFKREVAEAVNAYLRPVRSRYAELRTDPAMVVESLRKGAGKARAVAAETMEAVRDRVGLLPRA
jgi:tryptophanyl-tRNA synthetase